MGQLREFEAAARSFNNFLLSIYAAVYSAAAQDVCSMKRSFERIEPALVLAAADGIVMPLENLTRQPFQKQHSKQR
ncbi:MAG: hypothetical protein ACLRXQ_10530 [Phascolarctobacterium faecium]